MELDVEDVLVTAVGSVIGRFVLFVLAVWIGCTLGAAGLIAGMMADQGTWRIGGGYLFFLSPLLLFSAWALLNIPFMIYYLTRFIRGEGDGYLTWGVVIAIESLAVMLGYVGDFVHGVLPVLVAISVWLILLGMVETGVWLVRQTIINKWAREMGVLRALNAQRAAERVAEERERMRLEESR